MEDSQDELESLLAEKQRLKAALHHAAGRICGEVEGAEFSREVVAAITEAAFNQTQLLSRDSEAFARSVSFALGILSHLATSLSLPPSLSLSSDMLRELLLELMMCGCVVAVTTTFRPT